ncbi:MAG: hypothetical protein R3D43_02385 [Tepidamorphaceae bacterium]
MQTGQAAGYDPDRRAAWLRFVDGGRAEPDWAIATFIALGLVGALAAGPILSLPAAMMQPHNRAFGMGVFFTIYYLCIFAGPVVAGTLAETFGNAGVTFSFGAALLVFCGLCLAAFRRLEQRPAALAAASQ